MTGLDAKDADVRPVASDRLPSLPVDRGHAAESAADYVADEVLVRFEQGATPADMQSTAASEGATLAESVLGFQKMLLPAGSDVEAVVADLRGDARVDYAEPNYIARPQDEPDDEYYPLQWPLANIQAPGAWEITTGGSATIAVIDTGVSDHVDLLGRVLPGWNFVNESADVSDDYQLPYGHGTAVAGIIAAATDNGSGLAGVSWTNPILPVKVCDQNENCPYEDVAGGILYAVAHDAKVINVSITGWDYSLLLDLAVQAAWNNGAVIVAAAGNLGDYALPVGYPAALPNVVAVGAVDEEDAWMPWSSRTPDLVAPGVEIPALTAAGGYDLATGASFAAPFVSGTAALLWAAGAILNVDVVDALVEGVDEGVTWPTWKCCAAPGWDEVYGWGRLGAARAIDYDRDGWSGSLEQYLTTDAYDPCPPGDAWRPDFTQSGSVNATDVLSLKPVFGSASVRHDLDRSGAVSIGDVLALKRWFGLSC